MTVNVKKEVATMQRMTIGELRQKYAEEFGEDTRSRNKPWLVKRIVWRMQANVEGDLSDRARRRALEIADDADLRMKAPIERGSLPAAQQAASRVMVDVDPGRDKRLPMPGTVLIRKYKGRAVEVTVLAEGFEYEGERYDSLSAVAKAITGTHTNGFLFFRLNGKRGAK